MFSWLILSLSAFLILVEAQEIKFGDNKFLLSKCIKKFLSMDANFLSSEAIQTISDTTADQFSKSVLDKQQFTNKNQYLYAILKKRYPYFSGEDLTAIGLTKQVRAAIRKALENCVERQNLPNFGNDQPELAEILDYLRVDWDVPVEEMIDSPKDRTVLRKYANKLGKRIAFILRFMDINKFRRQLREIWMKRAQKLYDARSYRPYLRHRFTTDKDRIYSSVPLNDVYTIDYVPSFFPREFEDFTVRNPTANILRYTQVLCVHLPNDDVKDDIFSEYQCSGNMTSAQYDLEMHIDQAYKILFFNLELKRLGIRTDEDDTNPELMPIIMHLKKKIFGGDHNYRTYLEGLRMRLEVFRNKEFSDCFSSGGDEELIILLSLFIIKDNIVSTTSTTSTPTSTTTTTSTTSNYQEGSEKGGIRRKNDCGKYFPPKKLFKQKFFDENQESTSEKYQDINNVDAVENNLLDFGSDKPTFLISIFDSMIVHCEL